MREVLEILTPVFALYAAAGAITLLIIGPIFNHFHKETP